MGEWGGITDEHRAGREYLAPRWRKTVGGEQTKRQADPALFALPVCGLRPQRRGSACGRPYAPPPRPPCGPPAQRARSDAAAFVWHNTYSLGIQLESEKTLEGREVNEPHVKKTRSKTPTR